MSDEKTPANMFSETPPEVPKKPDLTPKVTDSASVETPESVADSVEAPMGMIVDLPSKGALGYPGSVSYREVMAGDEEILKTATNKNFTRTVNRVLKSVCNDPDFFDDLYIGDRDFILTSIWGNTYNSEKVFEVKCRHCGNVDEEKVNIFNIKTDDLHPKFKSRMPLKVKKTGETIHIRLVSVRDDNNSEKYLADNPKADVSFELAHYACAIEFGRPMSMEQRIEYIKTNLTAKENAFIKEYHRFFKFGLDTSISHVCSECEGVTHGSIPFLPEDIIAPDVSTDFEQLL